MSSRSEPDADWASGLVVEPDPEPPLVVVIDTSLVIDVKRLIGVNDGQWKVLTQMLLLVEQGRIAFPSKVHRELTNMKWADAPGAWCGEAVHLLQYDDPEDATMAAILVHTQDLVEENADNRNEKADPYVVAMAYELQQADPPNDVVVATTDCVDRLPVKIAMTTACDRLGIPTWDFETFKAWVRQTKEEA